MIKNKEKIDLNINAIDKDLMEDTRSLLEAIKDGRIR